MQTIKRALSVKIRSACAEDAERLYQIQSEAIEVLCAKDYTPKQIAALIADKRDRYSIGEAWGDRVVVAEVSGAIAGFAAMGGDRLNAIFVQPQYARRGIGQQLLSTLEREAIDLNFSKILVLASVTAYPFYRACGYQAIDRAALLVQPHVRLPCFRMEKTIKKRNR
jgi:putative acetyltransferase